MKSRFTIALITVGGLSGLGLVAFLSNGVREGIAHEQAANFAVAEEAPLLANEAAVPAYDSRPNAAPAFFESNQSQPSEPARAAPAFGASTFRNNSQPRIGTSISSQPIVVAIKDGPQLSGDTVNVGEFQFNTLFGVVSIPVDKIAGLRMADEPRQPATICLSNGDSLTGVLVTDSVTIKTAWGGATINRDQIISIVTTTEPVSWQQQEGRWKIILAEPPLDEAVEDSGFEADATDHPAPAESEEATGVST